MKKIVYALLMVVLMTSCVTQQNFGTRHSVYPHIYEEKPASILIMPPINSTTHVEAKEEFYLSMTKPLCERGYYVLPTFLSMEVFQSESAYDSEMFLEGDVKKFGQYFGADAVLFTVVEGWTKTALTGAITVQIRYILKSTKTNRELFVREGTLQLQANTNSGSLIGNLIGNALAAALTKEIEAARACNNYVLQDLPSGIYSPEYQKDKEYPVGNTKLNMIVPMGLE